MLFPPWSPLPRDSQLSCSCTSHPVWHSLQTILSPFLGTLSPFLGIVSLHAPKHIPFSCGRHILHTNEIINGTEVTLEILLFLAERLAHKGLTLPCCSSSSASKHLWLRFFFLFFWPSWATTEIHTQTPLQAPSNLNAPRSCLHF